MKLSYFKNCNRDILLVLNGLSVGHLFWTGEVNVTRTIALAIAAITFVYYDQLMKIKIPTNYSKTGSSNGTKVI